MIEETSQVQEQNKQSEGRQPEVGRLVVVVAGYSGAALILASSYEYHVRQVAWLQVCEAMCVCASYEMYCCLVRGEGGELTTHAKHTR